MNAHILKEEMLELVKIIRPKEIRKNHKLRRIIKNLRNDLLIPAQHQRANIRESIAEYIEIDSILQTN